MLNKLVDDAAQWWVLHSSSAHVTSLTAQRQINALGRHVTSGRWALTLVHSRCPPRRATWRVRPPPLVADRQAPASLRAASVDSVAPRRRRAPLCPECRLRRREDNRRRAPYRRDWDRSALLGHPRRFVTASGIEHRSAALR